MKLTKYVSNPSKEVQMCIRDSIYKAEYIVGFVRCPTVVDFSILNLLQKGESN